MSGSQPERQGGGGLQPTTKTVLVVAALAGGFASWMGVQTLESMGQPVPRVPWTAWAALALVAAVVGALAWATQRSIHVRHERVESGKAVSLLVLGKTTALAGTAFAAGYLMLAVQYFARMDAELPRERVVNSSIATLACAGLAVAGWFLERACLVPKDDENDTGEPEAP